MLSSRETVLLILVKLSLVKVTGLVAKCDLFCVHCT